MININEKILDLQSEIECEPFCVLLQICRTVNIGKQSRPKNWKLSKLTGLSERKITKATNKLQALGYIKKDQIFVTFELQEKDKYYLKYKIGSFAGLKYTITTNFISKYVNLFDEEVIETPKNEQFDDVRFDNIVNGNSVKHNNNSIESFLLLKESSIENNIQKDLNLDSTNSRLSSPNIQECSDPVIDNNLIPTTTKIEDINQIQTNDTQYIENKEIQNQIQNQINKLTQKQTKKQIQIDYANAWQNLKTNPFYSIQDLHSLFCENVSNEKYSKTNIKFSLKQINSIYKEILDYYSDSNNIKNKDSAKPNFQSAIIKWVKRTNLYPFKEWELPNFDIELKDFYKNRKEYPHLKFDSLYDDLNTQSNEDELICMGGF